MAATLDPIIFIAGLQEQIAAPPSDGFQTAIVFLQQNTDVKRVVAAEYLLAGIPFKKLHAVDSISVVISKLVP